MVVMSDDEDVKEMVNTLIDSFKNKVEDDDRLKDKLEGFNRKISLEFEDDGNFNFSIDETKVSELREGKAEDADIKIYTDTETLDGLLNEEIKGMEAYARKKVRLDAPFLDLLKIKDLF